MTTVKTLEMRFVEAVQADDIVTVKELLDFGGIKPETVRDSLRHLRKSVELAAYLIDKGADVKAPELLVNVMSGCTLDVMRFLIEKGCPLLVNHYGCGGYDKDGKWVWVAGKCDNNREKIMSMLGCQWEEKLDIITDFWWEQQRRPGAVKNQDISACKFICCEITNTACSNARERKRIAAYEKKVAAAAAKAKSERDKAQKALQAQKAIEETLRQEQERLVAERDRVAAEQEAERRRLAAEEAKQKTDLVLQITLDTDESLKIALDLIRDKSPLNITDNKNRTPLHLAAMMGHRAIVRALLMKQVDRELRDIHENRAEDLAKDDATRQVFLEVPSNQKIYTREFQTAHNIRDAAREAQDPRAKAYLDKAYHREQKTAGRRVFSQVNTRVAHDSYDLHAMETEPAKDMVKKLIADQRRLANRSGCTRVVTLILGRGNHSTDGNPSINPAIRGMLMKRNIDFHDQGMNDGAIEVRFTPLTTDDTSSVTDSISTSN